MSDDADRAARLRARTFRWNAGDDTTGYCAAEIDGGLVTWFAWSHVHGEGRRELGAQRLEDLRARGPLVPVPPRILGEILTALEAG